MSIVVFNSKKKYLYALILILLAGSSFQPGVKQMPDIVLQDEHLSISPKEFYIANVVDSRADRSAVAWLLPVAAKIDVSTKIVPVDLHGGTLAAIKQFIARNLPQDKTLLPVTIDLKKFRVDETVIEGNKVDGRVSLLMSFDINRGEGETEHLADYDGSVTYTRTPGPPQDIEPALRHLLEHGLVYLNTWMNKQAATNIKLAKQVKLVFADYKGSEDDTIYYDVNRPLNWNDFQSKTASAKYDAEVFPSIGYDEHAEVLKGILNINIALKVSMPKSACWVKDGSRNDYTLNHEQRHFDIAKWVAEHFKQKLKGADLPIENFDATINMEYLETYREMDNLEKQYDDETRHGTNEHAQQHWNELIDKQLRAYGVKK